MNKFISAAIAVSMLVTAGCHTDKIHEKMRTDPSPLSSFIPNHNLLVRQPDTFPFHYFYLKRKLRVYDNVYIEKVDISHLKESTGWAAFDAKLNGKLGTDIDELAEFTRKAYIQAFKNYYKESQQSKRLKVVDNPNLPNTLLIQPAIIALTPSKAELQALGIVGGFAVPGLGVVTSLLTSGSINVECIVKDAQTGEIVSMYADTEKDPQALLAIAKLTWTRSARINIKDIASQTAAVLSARDYHLIRRDFPIRFATRIIDGSLDDEDENE